MSGAVVLQNGEGGPSLVEHPLDTASIVAAPITDAELFIGAATALEHSSQGAGESDTEMEKHAAKLRAYGEDLFVRGCAADPLKCATLLDGLREARRVTGQMDMDSSYGTLYASIARGLDTLIERVAEVPATIVEQYHLGYLKLAAAIKAMEELVGNDTGGFAPRGRILKADGKGEWGSDEAANRRGTMARVLLSLRIARETASEVYLKLTPQEEVKIANGIFAFHDAREEILRGNMSNTRTEPFRRGNLWRRGDGSHSRNIEGEEPLRVLKKFSAAIEEIVEDARGASAGSGK